MKEVLRRFFPYEFQYEATLFGYTAFQEAEGWLVVIPADYIDENYVLELYVISEFLKQNGYHHIALPVYSNTDNFIIPINEDSSVFLCHASPLNQDHDFDNLSTFLQGFHHQGHQFPYSPLYVNRYGQWKGNWEHIVDQFDFIRSSLVEKDILTNWERLWLESSYYFIGLGENAIQYLQETEQEKNFNHYDQPIFTFERITPLPHQQIILPNRIVHDHSSRDLAELTRHIILKNGRDGLNTIFRILYQYQSKRPFSKFGWRLYYARLLFPIQFIDYSQSCLNSPQFDDVEFRKLNELIHYHKEYEYCLKQINLEINQRYRVDIPVIEWINQV